MNRLRSQQQGFAMPAIFLAVALAFAGSMNIETENGETIAAASGLTSGQQSEFASVETGKDVDEAAVEK